MGTNWQRLRPLEQLLLDDSRGTNAAVITAVFGIEGKIDAEWTTEYVAKRLLIHPRFSSVLSTRRGRARFSPIPGFAEDRLQIARHVKTHVDSPSPPSSESLDSIVSTALPTDRPLWELHVFPDTKSTTSALVFRVHHCVGDGIGLLRFFLAAVADGPPAAPPPGASVPLPARRPLHRRLVRKCRVPILRIVGAVIRPLRDAFTVFIKPLIPDSTSVYTHAERGSRKRAVFARPHPLSEIATAARIAGVSINDLTLAAVTGALRDYALGHGDKPRNLRRFHIAIPVNRHPPGDGIDTVSNAVTPLPFRAPLLHSDRVDRLALTTHRMKEMKRGLQPLFATVAFGIVRALPNFGRLRLWRRFTRVASALFTNMAGPLGKLRSGGREVSDIRVLAPSQGQAGMTVSAISYGGMFNVGLVCDLAQVSEPDVFMSIFNKELDALIAWTHEIERNVGNGAS